VRGGLGFLCLGGVLGVGGGGGGGGGLRYRKDKVVVVPFRG